MTTAEREHEAAVRGAAAYVHGAKVELAVLLDADGVEVWRGRGSRRQVVVPGGVPGGTVVHTHPAPGPDSPLSYADVSSMLDGGEREVVAVHRTWTHRLRIPCPRPRLNPAARAALAAMEKQDGATPEQLSALAVLLGGSYRRVPTEAWLAGAGWVAGPAGPARCLAAP